MASWLFVSTQPTNKKDERLQNDVQPGDLISHATRFMHTKRRQHKLKALKSSVTHFPVPVYLPVVGPQSSNPQQPNHSQPIAEEEGLHRQRTVSPSTILRRGQSDPFNSLAVEISPEANEIIFFFREYLILEFYNTKWENSKASVVSMHWQSVVQALHDKGSALGFLGRNAQILHIVSEDRRIKHAALRFIAESTTILRSRLEQSSDMSATNQWHISMLWGTEILFRNLNAALLHGRVLRRMVEDQARKGTLDLVAFRYILYYDIHLCTMLMVRSVFDYFEWVPEQYRKLAPLATSSMRYQDNREGDAADGLDRCIDENILLPIFQERRRHMREYNFWLERSFEEISPVLLAWLAVCHHICHGRLISYALDCIDNAAKMPEREGAHLITQAYLSLAALYVTRAIGGQLIVCGVDIFDARRSILDKMFTVLKLVHGYYSDGDYASYQNAYLWALYVGARGSRTLKLKPETHDWFELEFENIRAKMGLLNWSDTQDILKGFLHHEKIDPIDDKISSEVVR